MGSSLFKLIGCIGRLVARYGPRRAAGCLGWLVAALASGCGGPTVVVYTSQDQVYAEPILSEFTRQTGIRVRALYDSEAVKTVGLVNRLIAEANYPRCDVFWNNEEFRTRQLAARDLFRQTNGWRAVGFRSRRLVVNTNCLALALAPQSLTDLTNQHWRGKVALAYPLFGTTATHFLVLRQLWGEPAWRRWCQALNANAPFLVDGNSVVVRLVGRGEAWIGLTDSDDIAAGQTEGLPIEGLPLPVEGLQVPNTIAVLRQAPHATQAEALFQFLQQPTVLGRLVAAHALESVAATTTASPGSAVDWDRLLTDLDPATAALKEIFLR